MWIGVPLHCFVFLQLLLCFSPFVFSIQKFNYDLAQHRFLCIYLNWGLLIFLSLDIYVFCQTFEARVQEMGGGDPALLCQILFIFSPMHVFILM